MNKIFFNTPIILRSEEDKVIHVLHHCWWQKIAKLVIIPHVAWFSYMQIFEDWRVVHGYFIHRPVGEKWLFPNITFSESGFDVWCWWCDICWVAFALPNTSYVQFNPNLTFSIIKHLATFLWFALGCVAIPAQLRHTICVTHLIVGFSFPCSIDWDDKSNRELRFYKETGP